MCTRKPLDIINGLKQFLETFKIYNMIIKQNTTYSIGNILGTVDIPREYDANSTAYFNSLSVALTTSVKNKIDDFITSLKSNGLWDKITTILIPAHAPTKTDAFINLKTATLMAINSADYFTFTSASGFNCSGSTIDGLLTLPSSLSKLDFHIGIYNSTQYSVNPGNGKYQLIMSGWAYLGKAAIGWGSNIGATGFICYGSPNVTVNNATTNVLKKGVLLGTVSSNLVILNDDGTISSTSGTSLTTQSGASLTFSRTSTLDLGFVTAGIGLTSEESEAYRTLINSLMS